MRCPRCDHPVQFCECLPPLERVLLESKTLLVDLGWGRPYRIRTPTRLLTVLLLSALLILPLLFFALPLAAVAALTAAPGTASTWQQILGFGGGAVLALIGAWLLPGALMRILERTSHTGRSSVRPRGPGQRFLPR
ncbi:MAG: hypothetical protein QN172_07695 [Armatimonadota bacterium]|nr:hypothetical protein [Armatimonadota bacterium]MDR7438971.1 hypothetical protein [Armatimonadota bacterium]MDR7562869.1 hypothetical protein [Armatimonadota bacterium]MDR7568540.1 hypothetical protein [Armatimonadota bacterium]MDR7602326.1 hypothetical protein [Armatimonadota bacterium]